MVLSASYLSISGPNKVWDEKLFSVLLKFENDPVRLSLGIKNFLFEVMQE